MLVNDCINSNGLKSLINACGTMYVRGDFSTVLMEILWTGFMHCSFY